MLPESVVFTIIAFPTVLACVAVYCAGRVRRREALYRWAASHGYKLMTFNQPLLVEASRFPFTASKAQQIFRIEVEDAGNHKSGWLRLGTAWAGLASGHAEVKWDRPPSQLGLVNIE